MPLNEWIRVSVIFGMFLGVSGAQAQTFLNTREARDFESHDAQIALAIPSFTDTTTIGGYDIFATAVLRYAIREKFRAWPEKVQANGRVEQVNVGTALTYQIPRPLMRTDHVSAANLAQSTYMQASVWGMRKPYTLPNSFTGFEVEVFFTYAGHYQDYRADRLEEWKISDDHVALSVTIPRFNVALQSYFIDPDAYTIVAENGICFRNNNTGKCSYFNVLEKTQFRKINQQTREVTVTRFGNRDIEYTARLPDAFFAPNVTVSYVAMFMAYARGHWEEAEKHANVLLESTESLTEMRIDALLYKGAARFRRGEDGLPALQEAYNINPRSQVVARYLIMGNYLHFALGTPTGEDFPDTLASLSRFAGEDWVRESGLQVDQ